MAGRIGYYGGMVRDGLVLDLDAAKLDSYQRTGTIWTDISGNKNNGTLVNGPTFDSGNGGSIVFDGVNDYVNCGNILDYTSTNFSFSYWIYITSLLTNVVNQGPIIFYKGSYRVSGYYNQITQDGRAAFITNTSGVDIASFTNYGTITSGNTYNITYTRNGSSIRIYINGVDLTYTPGVHTNPLTSNNDFTIGFYSNPTITINSNIKLYKFLNYNKALSSQEVLQNYNATKGRYGL